MTSFLPSNGEVPQWEEEDKDLGDNIELFEGLENERACETGGTGVFSSPWNMGGLLNAITGNRAMNQGTIDPVLNKITQLLISKNVAVEVSADGCCKQLVCSVYTLWWYWGLRAVS